MKAFLGIDVSKGYADFALLDSGKKPLTEVFQLDDSRQGHQCLHKQLEAWFSQLKVTQLFCGLESTGGFENNWYASLKLWSQKLPLVVARLNPSGVKSNVAAGLNRNVTDALSSRYIANYLMDHPEVIDYNSNDTAYASFRSLHKHIILLKKQKTQQINQLKAVLYTSFPELLRYCKSSMPGWVLEVLKKYPSPRKIARLKPETLCKLKHVTREKAASLIQKAGSTVSSTHDAAVPFMLENLARQIQHIQQMIEKDKEFLINHCKGAEVTLLSSIPGIAAYSAAAIMIEIEDIKRFASPKKLTCYFGVHPTLKESGDKRPVYRMSKKGRSSMRAILYMSSMSAVLFDPHLKQIYHRHRSKGKSHKSAIGVIMQKLLRIIWGVLTHGKSYDARIDQSNQLTQSVNHAAIQSAAEWNKKRRIQQPDNEAPISRRQTKIRRVRIESQADINQASTGSSNTHPRKHIKCL